MTDSARYSRAHCTTQWLDADTALVTATGDIDATNAAHLGAHIVRIGHRSSLLILDFSAVGFFGVQGVSIFQVLPQTPAQWAVVSGPAVARVLRLCDADAAVPTVGSVDQALLRLRAQSRPTLHLIGD